MPDRTNDPLGVESILGIPARAAIPKSEAFCRGFEEAERQFYANGDTADDGHGGLALVNPYSRDTDEWEGFEAAAYIMTSK